MSSLEVDRVLAQIRALSAQARAPGAGALQAGVSGVADAARGTGGVQGAGSASFGTILRKGLEQVNAAQARSSALATDFERGVPGVELPQVMLEMQKASVSFRAATEVRNRLVEAYREIMNLPI